MKGILDALEELRSSPLLRAPFPGKVPQEDVPDLHHR